MSFSTKRAGIVRSPRPRPSWRSRTCVVVCAMGVLSSAVVAHADSGSHADPVGRVGAFLAVILLAAKFAGDAAIRMRQPAVLGELVAGVIIGNLPLVGVHVLAPIQSDAFIDMLARIGVLLLLFQVGLESTVKQMMSVGLSAFVVACVGVVLPLGLGWGVGAVLLPHASPYVHAFLGATLSATSVGITARVLKDIGRAQTTEARIILGAAVIDDVLGLVVLAVASGMIRAAEDGGSLSYLSIVGTVLKATGFLVGSLALGVAIAPRIFYGASKLRAPGVLLAFGLTLCFMLAWVADLIGLAPIVGAFAAGLVLEDVHYQDFVDRGEHTLGELVEPLSSFLVPVFFVVMGARTALSSFIQPGVATLAVALTVAAVVGKLACGWSALGQELDKLAIGIGMIPRGEVGLIFANMGLSLTLHGQRIVTPETYSALIVVIIITTIATPPALKWKMR